MMPFEEPLRSQCAHFLDCIRTGSRSQTDGRVGLKVVRLLEAADVSLQQGGARTLLFDGGRPYTSVQPAPDQRVPAASAPVSAANGSAVHASV